MFSFLSFVVVVVVGESGGARPLVFGVVSNQNPPSFSDPGNDNENENAFWSKWEDFVLFLLAWKQKVEWFLAGPF